MMMIYRFQELPDPIFEQINPAIQEMIKWSEGGYRTIRPGEFFFPSREHAEKWAEDNDREDAGYIVGIIVVLVLPDGQRIGLTTTAQFDRAEQQAAAYLAAHSASETSRGVMFKVWEVGFLPSCVN